MLRHRERGVAAYQGRLYLGALDGRLIAIDAATGKEAWSVVTVDPSQPYSITGAPRIVKGRSPGGGDNLYLSSIVAIKPETGEYV